MALILVSGAKFGLLRAFGGGPVRVLLIIAGAAVITHQ
jgi:hypothetical protein